jgi:replicative DNA helicase
MNQPQSIETERALLGSCIFCPENIPAISLKVTPQDFYLLRHQRLFATLLEMSKSGLPIDFVTVADRYPEMSFSEIAALSENGLNLCRQFR